MKREIKLIYKDKNFLALDKPAGLLVHPLKAKSPDVKSRVRLKRWSYKLKAGELTLVDWLIKNHPEVKSVGDPSARSEQVNLRPGIVHRLDRDTSGVIIIPRNQDYFNYLKNLFETHQIKKTYLALVYGKVEPKVGVIERPIRLKLGTVKRTIFKGKSEKLAITEYRVLKVFNHPGSDIRNLFFSLLRVSPKTGRTHQIRVHLASIGHPIVGDSLYGPKANPFGLNRQFLHAESLEFASANGRRIKIESALPKELKQIIDDLRWKV